MTFSSVSQSVSHTIPSCQSAIKGAPSFWYPSSSSTYRRRGT